MAKKTLAYFRHSLKGPDGNLSSEGKALALRTGQDWKETPFAALFRGAVPRTGETRDDFIEGWNEDITHPKGSYTLFGPITGVGDDATFKAMVTADMKAVMGTMTNLGALVHVHVATDAFEDWKTAAHGAVKTMFDLLEDGQIGAAFGHSPIIELVALGSRPTGDSVVMNTSVQLKEMEHITFELDTETGEITYTLTPQA